MGHGGGWVHVPDLEGGQNAGSVWSEQCWDLWSVLVRKQAQQRHALHI